MSFAPLLEKLLIGDATRRAAYIDACTEHCPNFMHFVKNTAEDRYDMGALRYIRDPDDGTTWLSLMSIVGNLDPDHLTADDDRRLNPAIDTVWNGAWKLAPRNSAEAKSAEAVVDRAVEARLSRDAAARTRGESATFARDAARFVFENAPTILAILGISA